MMNLEPRFPQKPQFGTTASLVHSVQYILTGGAARSRPSDGCSNYTVHVS